MIRTILIAAGAMSFLIATASGAAPCRDPKTHKFIKCPPPAAAATTSVKTTTTSKTSAKVCKTGKPCGNSCIAANKVCHK